MKTMKPILRFSLIVSLCLFLIGATYIITASAKITPNPDMEGTDLITIVKGDTLWDLAAKHLENSRAWPEFKQYNTFTDPNRIYPGEMMRIPVEVVVQIIEDTAPTIPLADLEAIQAELAEMEARAIAAEEAVGVTAADVTAIKKLTEDLIAQQKKVRSGLKDLKKEVDGLPDVVNKINKSLKKHAEASQHAIEKAHGEVKDVEEDVNSVLNTVKANQDANMEAHKATEAALAAAIKANGENIDRLHTMHAGATEEPNKSKRTLAFLTTLAGTAAWFAISALD